MSILLNDIIEGRVSLVQGLERLLVIANKIDNVQLANWCSLELKGYKKNHLPEYRKFTSKFILYSGVNGSYLVTDQPIPHGFLSENTMDNVSQVLLCENISDIIKRKDEKEPMIRDLTRLSSEVYYNTDGQVNCTQIKQQISPELYSKVYSDVRIRVINTLTSFENAKINIDNYDLKKSIEKMNFKKVNTKMYEALIEDGKTYVINKKENNLLYAILIPIIITIIGGLILLFIEYNIFI